MKTPNAWKEVSAAFSKALELDLPSRNSFLSTLSKSIREEVESLLNAETPENDFLETPVKQDAVAFFSAGDELTDFKLIEKIGEGSFGSVFKATQISLDRIVAVKITPNIGNEARVMAHLEHESIVKVFSETIDASQRNRFICMQYIGGENLEKAIGKFQSETAVIKLGISLSRALAYAHSKDVLHLDVKPSNILLNEKGIPLLTDFNISITKNRDQSISLYGGTKNFMPPEQEAILKNHKNAKSENLGYTCDIFSLGRVLEEILKHSKINPSPELNWILEKCTASSPSDRFQSALELEEHLQAALDILEIKIKLRKNHWLNSIAEKYPTAAVTVSILIPHFIATIINIAYNSMRIVSYLSPLQQNVFQRLMLYVNPIAYTIAVIFLFKNINPLLEKNVSDNKTLRKKTLTAQRRIALISFLCWGVCAVVFPTGISLLAEPVSIYIFGHFFLSFFMSTIVATTYSTLNSQYFFLRILYPTLWTGSTHVRETATLELQKVIPRLRSYYYISGTVPLISAFLMILVGPETLTGQSYTIYKWLLSTFVLMGIGGVFYTMYSSKDLSETVSTMTEI